jgi:hypothetical protein
LDFGIIRGARSYCRSAERSLPKPVKRACNIEAKATPK